MHQYCVTMILAMATWSLIGAKDARVPVTSAAGVPSAQFSQPAMPQARVSQAPAQAHGAQEKPPSVPALTHQVPTPSSQVEGLPVLAPPTKRVETQGPAQFQIPGAKHEPEKEEAQGIDTLDVANAQGNWLFKRMWWQRAETQYEKIKAVVEAIMESRMAFFAKRTEWDKTLFDPFYLEAGLGRGVLEELIGSLINQLNQERVQAGQLDEKERYLLSSLESQKGTLEQLQKDVQKINDIDNAVDEAISVLIKQINMARNFEKQSWQNFKAIAQELDDKKARELYYGMVTFWQNINEIGQYIQQPFLQHFEKLGSLAKEQTSKVLNTLKALKERGIDFKKQWQEVEENNGRQKEAHDYKEGLEEGKKEAEAKQKAEEGYFTRILTTIADGLSTTWQYIKTAGQTAWDFTFGRFFAKNVEPAPVGEAELPAVAVSQSSEPLQTTPASVPLQVPATILPAAQVPAPMPAPVSVQVPASQTPLPVPVSAPSVPK